MNVEGDQHKGRSSHLTGPYFSALDRTSLLNGFHF